MRAERNIEFIRLGQAYVESKGEDEGIKRRVTEVTSSMENLYMPPIMENLKRAVEENAEDAVIHDFNIANNKNLLNAFHEYAGNIKFSVNSLDLPIVFQALTSSNKMLKYEQAADSSLEIAKGYIKKIAEETNCNAKTARSLAIDLAFYVCELSYGIFHREEFNERNIAAENLSEKIFNLMNAEDIERDEYIEHRTLLNKALEDINYTYARNIYKIDQSAQIAREWIKELFPGEVEEEWFTDTPTNAIALAKPKRIENYFIPIDKFSRAISTGFLENGDKDIPVYMTNDQRYQALVSMDFLNLPNVSASENFNYFEWQVHNAMVSLALHNDWFTDYMIYEVVARTYYNKADANPSEQMLEEIREIVSKIINCRIKVDTSKDVPLKEGELRSFEGLLIAADKETRILNGRVREGYLISRNSLAYHYANKKGQVITVPLKLLHTKIRFSKETSILKEYLVQRIALMKNGKNKISSYDILYETAFEYIPFTQKTARAVANKKTKLKGFAITMLDELKEEGFIAGYNAQKKDRITIQV